MRFRSLFAALAVAALAAGPIGAVRANDPAPHDAQAASAPSGASLYQLPSKWTTQDGVNVTLVSFAGAPVVAAMGYTTCKDICPAIVANMMWIEKHLPPDAAARVRFAFFSFDPEADTPERLKTLRRQPWARSCPLDAPARRR